MAWYIAGAILLGMVWSLMAMGVPVAIAFMIVNLVGTLIFVGDIAGLTQVVDNSTALITRFQLAPVPLFLLMGSLFFHSGLTIRVFDALGKLFSRLPGRFRYLTIAGGATFSTLTGSRKANTSMPGSLTAPAMIIPPSSLCVLLASIAGVDLGRLLIAGIFPGLLLAGLYAALISAQVTLDPSRAPSDNIPPSTPREKLRAVCVDILPMSAVVVMVAGFIILGIVTPAEAAAFGVLGVLILIAAFRLMTWDVIRLSLESTVRVAGMVFFIVMSSTVFSQLLAYSGVSAGMLQWAAGFEVPTVVMLLMMFAALLILGMFMDPVSTMLISVPIFFPLAAALDMDRIWFGIFVLLALAMTGRTPPFGLLLHIKLGIAPPDNTLFRAAAAAFPYLVCDAILIGLLIAFPAIALYLPGLMG